MLTKIITVGISAALLGGVAGLMINSAPPQSCLDALNEAETMFSLNADMLDTASSAMSGRADAGMVISATNTADKFEMAGKRYSEARKNCK